MLAGAELFTASVDALSYCWAIAIAKAVEVAVNIANPRDKKQVSHQYLIDKVDQVKDDGIARLFEAWQYIKKYGICEEKDYPTNPAYERNDVQIEVEAEQKLKIFNFDESATVKEMQLIDQLNKGPVVATVKAYPSFNLWKANVEDDVYLGPTLDDKHRKHGKIPEHALLLTGYGQNKDGVPFFHCTSIARLNYFGCLLVIRHIEQQVQAFSNLDTLSYSAET
ncbi:hypothetical protein LINPERHAP1_LOCUS31948 [Linum perenne]